MVERLPDFVVERFPDFAFSTASISASSASSRMLAWAMRNKSTDFLARRNSVLIAACSEPHRCPRFSFDIQVSTAMPTTPQRPSVGNVGKEWRIVVPFTLPPVQSYNAFEWIEFQIGAHAISCWVLRRRCSRKAPFAGLSFSSTRPLPGNAPTT